VRAAAAVLGSRYRGDDAVGPLVGDRLRERGVELLDCGDEPTRLIDRFSELDLLVVVDAVRSHASPGTVHCVCAEDGELPRDPGLASTHALAVTDALALAEVLGRGPGRVVLVGIEGRAFGMGDPVTPAVVDALDEAVDAVLQTLEEARCTRRP
jgi:hydrogenase maturation protease